MNDKHLMDLSKLTVYIELGHCFEFYHPIAGMQFLDYLLNYEEQHIDEILFASIDKLIFNNLLKKFKKNKSDLDNLYDYIKLSNKKLLKNEELEPGTVIPMCSFQITIEELIVFYKSLEIFNRSYNEIKEEIWILPDIVYYFKYITSIQNMLEKRLAYAIINKK